jgi:Zn-dependent peptidase ImmA (M78 family)
MRPVSVPPLASRDIERAAEELLQQYASERGAPLEGAVDVDFVIERVLGLDLAVVDLKGLLRNPAVLGATVVDQRRIYVDESLEPLPGRFAFTLAHEVGHWQLHRPYLAAAAPAHGSTLYDVEALGHLAAQGARSKKPTVEWQADQFAACLLMPARLVRSAVHRAFEGRLPAWEGVEARLRAGEADPRFVEVAAQVLAAGGFVNVSNTAMRIRLMDLGLVLDTSNPQASLL